MDVSFKRCEETTTAHNPSHSQMPCESNSLASMDSVAFGLTRLLTKRGFTISLLGKVAEASEFVATRAVIVDFADKTIQFGKQKHAHMQHLKVFVCVVNKLKFPTTLPTSMSTWGQ